MSQSMSGLQYDARMMQHNEHNDVMLISLSLGQTGHAMGCWLAQELLPHSLAV